MSIVYSCRHCGNTIGQMERHLSSMTMLLDELTATDKRKMIHYKQNGDVHIKVICENCETSLQEHPHYYELDYFIQ